MIDFLSSWIKIILSVYIFIALVEILLPSNKFKKYVKFVLGFIVLVAILTPVFKFFDKGINVENTVSEYYNKYYGDASKSFNLEVYNRQLVDEFKNNLKKRIENDIRQKLNKEFTVEDIKINEDMNSLGFGKIESITLSKNYSKIIKPVEKVTIGRDLKEEDYETILIKKYLHENLGIRQENIRVIK
ncbi:stage III sporulation protein AF [Caloramator fervidus]|nr:stage III sporulation protein AF [Caloramator fervidus]